MNLLAHAYLSFNQPAILVGNMISDYVKGKSKFQYPEAIQKGIMLHRAIDEFTDNHLVTQQAKKFFRPVYRLYAGAFMDVVYDHFLANDTNEFKDAASLDLFARSTYIHLEENKMYLPPKFLQLLPFMKLQNWLYHYKDRKGIEKSFAGLVHRSAYLQESTTAFAIFEKEHNALQQYYQAFFPSLKHFAKERLQTD